MLNKWIVFLSIATVLCWQKLKSNSIELFNIADLDQILIHKGDLLIFMNVKRANEQYALKSFDLAGNVLKAENKRICDDGGMNSPLRLCSGGENEEAQYVLEPVDSKKNNYLLKDASGAKCAIKDFMRSEEVLIKSGSCSDMNVIHFLVAPFGKFAKESGDLPADKHKVAENLSHDNRIESEKKSRNFQGEASPAEKLETMNRQLASILNDNQKRNN